jgi:type IV pilus assembly protein PilY1
LDGNNTTATCSTYTSTGSGSSRYYYCTSFALSGTDIFGSASNPTTASVTVSSKKYYTSYKIINNVSTATTVYFTPTYTGTYGTSVYYASTYNVSIGSGSQTYPVRVQVCNSSIGIEGNCQQYLDSSGNATWKPTGVLQGNGNTMRFGVTSYFNANDIDNAILRSKAKYLAPDQVLLGGSIQSNAFKEWSATDGTFINNPDSADTATMTTPWGTAPANSGVINYINKFGTVAQGYKTYDDIGKLYYETLRYLRGGNFTGATSGAFTPAPTTDFYNGAKSTNNDGFPVITTWDDPVKYSCQKNYIITMGDAHTWCDKRLPGGTYSSVGSTVCNAYTDGNSHAHVQDTGSLSGDSGIAGSLNGTSITGTAAATNVVGSMEAMGAIATTQTGAGGASYYMAGLAAWAATNNIRPDMASSASPMNVKSFIIDVQEAQDCSFDKQFWLAAKYGDPGNYTAGIWSASTTWYNSILGNSFPCASNSPPNYGSSTLMMKWPKNLLRASDPISMINSVKSAIQSIAAEQGAEAALSQSAGALNTGTGAYIYQGAYNSGGWLGDLKAFVIDQTGAVSATPDWTASQNLPNPSARVILSFSRGTTSGDTNHFTGINFAPDSSSGLSNFDAYQQNLLNKNNLGTVDSFGVDRVKYLRGDMSKEAYMPSTTGATVTNTLSNHGWRSRLAEGTATGYTTASYTTGPTGQLGDIVNSNPVYVGAPILPLADATYKAFALARASRTPMVYVGGNDGMLHAYNASYTITSGTGLPAHTSTSGDEIFAYVPYANYPTLSNLMSPNYAHTFYVDGSPVSGDVCMASTGAANCDGTNDAWKTILVGGLNAGGKGIYALDITDPVSSIGTTNVLWEFTNLDDPDMGYTFSQPVVAKLNNGRWAVILGNGFNSVDVSGNPNNNKAYLYILYVDPKLGSSQQWVQNTNYFKIALTSPGTPNNVSNGLAGVSAVDVNQDGKIDYVYAGDRNGNMWKVDLSSATASSWGSAFSGAPLFTAQDSAGHLQQITTTPKIGNNPNGGYMVMFGTGSWTDTEDTSPQNGSTFYTDTLYGIWDQDTGLTASPATGRSVLQRQAIIGSYSIDNTGATCTSGNNCTTYTVQSSCSPNYTTTSLANPGNGLTGNQTNLCPQYVPTPPAYSSYSTVTLAATTGTSEQFGWYFDMPGNGERSHSNPPSLIGTNIQFTSLTPSTNPCTGNTLGFEYNFNYLTGAAPSAIFILPGTTSLTNAGVISMTLPGSSTPTQVTLSGKTLSGGAAQNPINFNANIQAAVSGSATIAAPAGMPNTTPSSCTTGNCTSANFYIPGWGFLMNMYAGPASAAGRISISCTNNENGTMTCTPRLRPGQFGRLSWKQIN